MSTTEECRPLVRWVERGDPNGFVQRVLQQQWKITTKDAAGVWQSTYFEWRDVPVETDDGHVGQKHAHDARDEPKARSRDEIEADDAGENRFKPL